MTAYDRLTARAARIATINEAASMLNWDAAAMMPNGGAAARGDQLAVLAGLAHGLATAPEMADDLAAAEAAPPPGEWERANLRLLRHGYTRATAVPGDLVEAMTRASSSCEMIWREARAAKTFADVQPALTELMGLVR
jgi:carboxypeptidase Taq